MKTRNGALGLVAIFTAIAASLCCILPLIALVAGLGGLASAFGWLGPLRPYLIIFTFLVLAFAWYQKLKPVKPDDCACDENTRPRLRAKILLPIVTVFAILTLALPYYSRVFHHDGQALAIPVDEGAIETMVYAIEGMTCTGCEDHIEHAVHWN